jgi:hypothetical protein
MVGCRNASFYVPLQLELGRNYITKGTPEEKSDARKASVDAYKVLDSSGTRIHDRSKECLRTRRFQLFPNDIGTVTTLANETSALKAAQALRIGANAQAPRAEAGPSTIAELVSGIVIQSLEEGFGPQRLDALRTGIQTSSRMLRNGGGENA